MRKKENSGFSLVELIVVVAIMAIAIGVLAPQLIKYIEKTKVSSDMQLADTVRTAVSTAIVDAEVENDPASQPFLQAMESSSGMNIDNDAAFLSSNCVLKKSLETSFGFSLSQIMVQLRSAHGNSHFNVKVTNNAVLVTITCTDVTGRKEISASTPENDIFVD